MDDLTQEATAKLLEMHKTMLADFESWLDAKNPTEEEKVKLMALASMDLTQVAGIAVSS